MGSVLVISNDKGIAKSRICPHDSLAWSPLCFTISKEDRILPQSLSDVSTSHSIARQPGGVAFPVWMTLVALVGQ